MAENQKDERRLDQCISIELLFRSSRFPCLHWVSWGVSRKVSPVSGLLICWSQKGLYKISLPCSLVVAFSKARTLSCFINCTNVKSYPLNTILLLDKQRKGKNVDIQPGARCDAKQFCIGGRECTLSLSEAASDCGACNAHIGSSGAYRATWWGTYIWKTQASIFIKCLLPPLLKTNLD